MENIESDGTISLLNLPGPILVHILELLSPMELIMLSEVCKCLRDRCRSDSMWEVHMKQKWGGVIGDVAYKEWQWHITSAKEKGINQLNQQNNGNGSLGSLSGTWPMLYLRSYLEDCSHLNGSLANSYMMTLYFSLQNGKFWFPAQIYRGALIRDALVRYNSTTDNFQARHQNGGWNAMGNNIGWDTLRGPPVDTPPYVRYVSDCLQDLKPGDYIEIQWKLRKEVPYDWWLAVIGHMESCNQDQNLCRCHHSDGSAYYMPECSSTKSSLIPTSMFKLLIVQFQIGSLLRTARADIADNFGVERNKYAVKEQLKMNKELCDALVLADVHVSHNLAQLS
ncbi:hypothetical protein VNO78_16746 [Psophocarpus tetragonolobus]|uniref:F-box domain-containing protein n=1 Tax=Psophocarpus tetragonolobus TaxID=3891 RepID=A0AAN9XKB4_PSOTE